MFAESLKAGRDTMRDRTGLVLILYGVNIAIALIVALPVYGEMVRVVGGTGFGADLLKGHDFLLWLDVLNAQGNSMGEAIGRFMIQSIWILPVYLVWKSIAHMGVIYALHNGGIWPFWRGVGYYGIQGLTLALAMLPIKVLCIGGLIVFWQELPAMVWLGPVSEFWILSVLFPLIGFAVLAIIDLVQRYARMAIVIKHESLWEAIRSGIIWHAKYKATSYVFLVWYGIALVCFVVSVILNAQLHIGVNVLLIAFLIQQAMLLLRTAVSVGWMGSEVYLFEHTLTMERPLIADTDERGTPVYT